ncbi:hypothetical protein M0Q97_13940 [Candidatus Dojkabacteria bacterium]|nr:hypothetical protein [Candidatus Dojkabacteria bacterium]
MKNFKIFVNENIENFTTLYHGTSDNKQEYIDDKDYIFLSISPRFAQDYGDKLLQVKVNIGKVFNSLSLSDIQLLYKNGFKLYDPNVDEEMDDIGYNFNKDEFKTAKAFINSPTNNNTWDAIESTECVIEWIFNNGFDSILITEDDVENYICKKQNIKNIEPYEI